MSYYPFWHGTIDNLGAILSNLGTNFPDKEVQIVETAYYYQHFPSASAGYDDITAKWTDTPAGQQAFIDDLVAELNKHSNVTGLYYWCAEENGSGKSSTVITHWLNRGLWNANTGRALPALFSLKKFCGNNMVGIEDKKAYTKHDYTSCAYLLNGIKTKLNEAAGIYICGGKKYTK